MSGGPERRSVRKVVGYVVHDDQLLVFTHDGVPLDVAGVQVPAGTIEQSETPAAAVVREVLEETGLAVRIVHALGVEVMRRLRGQDRCDLGARRLPVTQPGGVPLQRLRTTSTSSSR
ncbi:NUDIX domain-containing protein [Microbacterium sp. CH-015]|uniref:NUDIX domain-containing protein n=1 Tax=Microbacterium sp. CH-015 TaxID=3406734 RepID=UPI003C789188